MTEKGSTRRSRWTVGLALGALAVAAPLGAAPPPKVDAADPPSSEQGAVALDVRVLGSGYDDGSTVDFFVTKTRDPGGVAVNSVQFVSPEELVANIDVAEDATVSAYDIEVTTSRGRRGKGTEKFSVTQSGNPNLTLIRGTFRDATTDRFESDGNGFYEDQMPDTGNLVFQPATRVFRLRLNDNPEIIEPGGECDDNPAEVCLRDGSTRVNTLYDTGFLSINKLEDGGLDCAGNPFDIVPRDLISGECIQVYVSSSMEHPGSKPTVKLRLRCGKHPWEGDDQMRLECLDSDADGCLLWDLRPFLDGSGNEHLTCQLYHLARKGNEVNLELAEYDIVFAMTISRVVGN